MRRTYWSYARGVAAVALMLALTVSVSARPREERPRDSREKRDPIVKIIKKVIRSLGDGLISPTP